MKKPKLLVAGYGTWAKAQANPAKAVALEMGEREWVSCDVIGVGIPVDSLALEDEIDRLLKLHSPDAWIGIGVSSAAVIQAEMIGINWRDFDVPDMNGQTLKSAPIVEHGPVAYNASLPNEAVVAAIRQAGIPAALSFHAGTHLCNQMLFTCARLIELHRLPTLNGFIHIPHTPENVLETGRAEASKASMPLSMSAEALVQCIETTAVSILGADQKECA